QRDGEVVARRAERRIQREGLAVARAGLVRPPDVVEEAAQVVEGGCRGGGEPCRLPISLLGVRSLAEGLQRASQGGPGGRGARIQAQGLVEVCARLWNPPKRQQGLGAVVEAGRGGRPSLYRAVDALERFAVPPLRAEAGAQELQRLDRRTGTVDQRPQDRLGLGQAPRPEPLARQGQLLRSACAHA